MMKSRISTLLKFFIGWPLSLIALFFIGKYILSGIPSITKSVTHVDIPSIILSLICFLGYFVFRAVLWHQILKLKTHSLPFMETAHLWAVSELRRYVPGNVWSILGRTTAFNKKSVKHTTTLSGFAVESEYFLLGGGLVSIPSILFLLEKVVHVSHALMWANWIDVLFFILLFFILFVKEITNRAPSKMKKIFKHGLPYFPFFDNLTLLGISTIAFAFLGVGTYFAVSSVASLPLTHIVEYSSFFVLAMVIGFASFIMPMGLGVREGIIIAGLAPLFPLSIAAFLAFFARFLLIIGELVFLLAITLWVKGPARKVKASIEAFTWQHRHELLLGGGIVAYILYFTTASFLRYVNFYTGRFDLGNMDQTVWNSAHGRFFSLTNPDGTNIITRLSVHADFLLVLLAPFYLIWQDPRMLLLIQTIALALGSIFVYLLAKDSIKNKSFALLLGLLYLIYPAVQHVNLYDFHAVALATTFFLAAFYFLQKNNMAWFIVFLILAGLTKEETWTITALMGLYAATIKQKRILGTSIFFISLGIFWYVFFKAIPHAHGGQHFALAYYSDFGSTPSEVIRTIFLSPIKTFSVMFAPDKLNYLKQLYLPLGFLPLIGFPLLIFTAPDMLIDLLSNNPQLHQIYYQYSSDITPFLFIAVIFATRFLLTKTKISLRIISCALLLFGLFGAYSFGPLPGEKFANTDMFTKQLSYATDIDEFLSSIPARYSIAATNNLGSHLSHRQKIFTIPIGVTEADVVVFLLNDKNAQPSLPAQKEMANQLAHDPAYVELFRDQDFVAFAKKDLNFQKRLRKEAKFLPYVQQLLHITHS